MQIESVCDSFSSIYYSCIDCVADLVFWIPKFVYNFSNLKEKHDKRYEFTPAVTVTINYY